MNVLPFDKQVRVIASVVDGVSIRATERMTDVNKKTIMRLARTVGEGCTRLHDRMFVDLGCSMIQLDEQWGWVHTKTGNLRENDPASWGEQWTWLALDVASRAKIAYHVGKRTAENAFALVGDVRRRVAGRPTIAADGLRAYVDAIKAAFGDVVHFGQLVKMYDGDETNLDRQVKYKGATKVGIIGTPNLRDVSTSLIERSNLQARLNSKRFTRQTLCFSKDLSAHRAAVALDVASYNLCRVHGTLRVTPAMQLGIADHVWSVGELIEAALAEPTPPAPPVEVTPPPGQMVLAGIPFLRVIRGGRE